MSVEPTPFTDEELTAAAVAIATRWTNLNYLRHALVLGGWVAAMKTFSLPYHARG